jgi:outer membrane receptor for ferrienterochelin and colicin
MYTGANANMSSTNLSADVSKVLLAAVPARVLAANPNLVPSAAVKSIWDNAWSLGGPVVTNRLWFVITGKYSYLNQVRLGSYEPDGSLTPDDNRIRDGSVKLSWQATRNSQLHFLYDGNNKNQYHRSGNATADFADSAATWRQSNYWNLLQPKWTMTLSSKMVLDTSASFLLGKEYLPPQPDVPVGTIPKFDSVLRNHTDAFEYYQRHPGHRDVAQTSLSYIAGRHDLRFGYQFMHVRFQEDTWSLSNYPAGLRAVYRNGVPDSVNTYDTPVLFEQYYRNHAVYVQDKWTPIRKLTLNLGLRLETFYVFFFSSRRRHTS